MPPLYSISDKNLKIKDSYKISKKEFSTVICDIKSNRPGYKVWNRSISQMCLEWACHNAAYAMNIKRSSSKDVDLNYPQPFIERAIYAVVGCAVWLFIK